MAGVDVAVSGGIFLVTLGAIMTGYEYPGATLSAFLRCPIPARIVLTTIIRWSKLDRIIIHFES